MVSYSGKSIIKLGLILFLLTAFYTGISVYAQSNTINGTMGSYNFPAGQYEIISQADDIFSPVAIISEGKPPSSTYSYISEGNGYLYVQFEPTAGNWLLVEVGDETGSWGYTDSFSVNVQDGETVTFTVTPPSRQTDYEMLQDDESGPITFIDTFSWDTTSGIISYQLELVDVPDVEFGWYPREPARGEDVTFYTQVNTMTVSSMTWLINGVELDSSYGSSTWTYTNIQDGVYAVTLRVEDMFGATAEKTYTITVGESQVFQGVICDDLGNRYEDLTVHFYWNDVLQGTTYTDADGHYEFTTVNGQPITLPLNGMGEVKIEFIDKDQVFEIYDLDADLTKPVYVTYPVTAITSADQLEYNIGFFGDMADDEDTADVNEALIDEHALIFYYTNIAKRFYADELNFIFINTPVYVCTLDAKDTAFFKAPPNPMLNGKTDYPLIAYTTPTRERTTPDAPINREFHEFSHYVMWDHYTELPELHYTILLDGKRMYLDENHDGTDNHCTSDSYVEGYAEFMALVINKEMNVQPPTASMLPDFAWSRYPIGKGDEYLGYNILQKKDEELCFASLLWDLYDGVEDADFDSVDLTLEQVWDILMQPYVLPKYYEYDPATQYPEKLDEKTTEVRYIHYIKDLYDGLMENDPFYDYTANEIDALFISHGIFNDINADGTWQQGEPIGINLSWGSERRKHPVDESWLLTLDIPENMLPVNITVTTTHEGSFTQYDHEYTVTVYDYPAQIPIIMPPEKYTPEMTVEVTKQGYTDTNPLVLDPATYDELITTQGNLGSHTPSLETTEEDEYIYINQVDSPATVEAGSTITLTASLEYSFNEITLISLGVYDYATESYAFDETYWVQGTDIEDYVVQFTAPDTPQTLELEANVIFQIGEEWYYTDNDQWYNYFTIDVVEAANQGIPGYPLPAILSGIALVLLLMQRKKTSY